MTAKVLPAGEVANYGTNYFLLEIKFFAERKRGLISNSQLFEAVVGGSYFFQFALSQLLRRFSHLQGFIR